MAGIPGAKPWLSTKNDVGLSHFLAQNSPEVETYADIPRITLMIASTPAT